MTEMLTPRALEPGDGIAIVSPAGIIKPALVYEAMMVLAEQGWKPVAGRHTFDRFGTFAGTDEARYDDLEWALTDPQIRAIVCSRGGYGTVRLLERLDRLPLRDDPKWVVGYSDITALHALMGKHGIMSIHAGMCKHLAQEWGRDEDSRRLFALLRGERPEVVSAPHPLNRRGEAAGVLRGGNVAVMGALEGTPYSIIRPGTILFIEDIAEAIYKVERMLYNLHLSGAMRNISGLIVGQFTNYEPSRDFACMEDMIARMVEPYSFPVAYGVAIGHEFHNIPMLCGEHVSMKVDETGLNLRYCTTI